MIFPGGVSPHSQTEVLDGGQTVFESDGDRMVFLNRLGERLWDRLERLRDKDWLQYSIAKAREVKRSRAWCFLEVFHADHGNEKPHPPITGSGVIFS